MQTWSGPNTGGASSPTRKFITTILIIFSLAGLVIGFTVGGLTQPKTTKTGSTNPQTQPTVSAQITATATPTATPAPDIVLDPPTITKYIFSEVADGTTTYTLSVQPLDKNTHKPISAADITCRIWLAQKLNETNSALKANNYALLKNIKGFDQPFPQEVANGLTVTAPASQVQLCASNGATSWTYSLPPTVQPGSYYIYILADWKGIHFNWNARQIQVTA